MHSNNDPAPEKTSIKAANPAKKFRFQCTYSKRKYQFVLGRVLFCTVTYEDITGENCAYLYFYKDGTFALDGAANVILNQWSLTLWPQDFNVAFWELREAVRVQAQLDKGYTFTCDTGLDSLVGWD